MFFPTHSPRKSTCYVVSFCVVEKVDGPVPLWPVVMRCPSLGV